MEDKKLKILIADDEDGLRLSMAGIIELVGHEVLTAVDGPEAIALAKQNSFDIAFLDIKMPGINGVDTYKEIKKVSPETVVVMMTAYAVQHLIREAISEGAYACMNKPFDMDKIMETIKEVSRKPFVVVIEDDPALCTTLNQKFRQQGFNVITKSNGVEGIGVIGRKIPDVIFWDINEHSPDAVEAFKKIKESLGDKCPRTILLSNNPLNQNIEDIMKLGNVEYIQRPADNEELKNAVDRILEKGKKLKVCIVDDDKTLCDSLKTVLSADGYEVDTANSGDEALNKMKDEDFKVVILDIRLPDVNGLEIYDKIKCARPGVGVIFISSETQNDNLEGIVKKNNYIYLNKPFNPEDLIKMLENIEATKQRDKS